MTSDPNADIQRNQLQARQATTRPKVIYVLVASVAFIVIGFFAIYFVTIGWR